MAILIDKTEKGEGIYQSVNQTIITDNELEKANELNNIVNNRISEFVTESGIHSIKKNKVKVYWKLGEIIRDIYDESGLV